MESKKEVMHTPEPCFYGPGKGNHEGAIVITSYTMPASSPLAHISNICDDAEPDARRIVACVNACKGVDNETLDKIAKGEMEACDFFELSKLKAQREELLAIVGVVARVGVDFGYGPFCLSEEHINSAREAIAKYWGKS